VEYFWQTLREKNQSPPQPLSETREPINRTLLKKFQQDLHEHFSGPHCFFPGSF